MKPDNRKRLHKLSFVPEPEVARFLSQVDEHGIEISVVVNRCLRRHLASEGFGASPPVLAVPQHRA